MQKKSIISILSVTMALIVASLALVFTVGPLVHADGEIGILDDPDYFETYEYDDEFGEHWVVLSGLSDEGRDYAWNYEYVDVIVPNGVNIIRSNKQMNIKSLGDDWDTYYAVFPENVISISLPDTVIEIGNDAFNYCYDLTTVNFAEDSALENIGHRAFSNCQNLTQINIPDTVTEIGNSAFSDCSSLTQINIPDGVTSIYDYTFAGCSNLQSVKLPDNLEHIGEGAFQCCYYLQSVKLPDNLEYIGDYALQNCYNLRTFIPDTVEYVGNRAFDGCDNTIYCAAENQPDGWVDDWRCVLQIVVSNPVVGNNPVVSGPVFNRDDTLWNCELSDCLVYELDNNEYTIVGYVGNFEDKNLVLPKTYNNTTVTKIGYGAFESINATSIIVPDSITEIKGFAFTNCDVETIMISDTVATMGKAVFDGGYIHNIYFEIAEDAIPANWDAEWNHHLENCGYDSGNPYEKPIWIATNIEYGHEIVEPEPQTPTDPNENQNENQNTTEPEQPANNEQPENKVNVAAVAGGTAGGVAGLGTIGTIIGVVVGKKRRK